MLLHLPSLFGYAQRGWRSLYSVVSSSKGFSLKANKAVCWMIAVSFVKGEKSEAVLGSQML